MNEMELMHISFPAKQCLAARRPNYSSQTIDGRLEEALQAINELSIRTRGVELNSLQIKSNEMHYHYLMVIIIITTN